MPRYSRLFDPNTWINEGVGQVCQGIKENDGGGGQHGGSLDNRVVALGNGIQGNRTDTRDIEELFGDEDARDQKCQRRANHGNQRNGRVAQGMAIDDDTLDHSFCTRSTYIVLPQYL